MKFNKIATAFCAAALGMMMLTSCEGGDLFSINAPDWLSSKADSIAAEKAKNQGGDVIEGMEEDVYTVGATDFSTGWWAQFSKYYQIPEGQTSHSSLPMMKTAVLPIIRSMVPSVMTTSLAVTQNGATISTVAWQLAILNLAVTPIAVLTDLAVR